MRLLDCYPARGMFTPGERVTVIVEVESAAPIVACLRCHIFHLAERAAALTQPISLDPGRHALQIEWSAPVDAPRGYGVEVQLVNEAGQTQDSASTAFDVLPHWTAFPRYGFLTDFSPGRTDVAATIEGLTRYHLNGLQFYDWQYRHDHLLPPGPESDYRDPLGRTLSLDVVRAFIEAAHASGLAALPYLAVYAASAAFWRAHPDWAMYDAQGKPIPFGDDFLGLMNPVPGGLWVEHLLAECERVLAALPFDGLHVDQYGDPKMAFDHAGQPVDLPAAFAGFTSALKAAHPQATVLFNAVGNWPIEALAASPQDFAYVEVWPPATAYRDLQHTLAQARALSGGKPVVVALYLPATQPVNIRLADALIFACGGSRIELGERERLLADPYFPKHQALPPGLRSILRCYYDFAVRYGELIGPAAGDAPELLVNTRPGVWCIARTSSGWLTINLINMTGLDEPRWDLALAAPTPLTHVLVQITALNRAVRQVWWASPEHNPALQPVRWEAGGDRGHGIQVTLPHLEYWAILALELEPHAG